MRSFNFVGGPLGGGVLTLNEPAPCIPDVIDVSGTLWDISHEPGKMDVMSRPFGAIRYELRGNNDGDCWYEVVKPDPPRASSQIHGGSH